MRRRLLTWHLLSGQRLPDQLVLAGDGGVPGYKNPTSKHSTKHTQPLAMDNMRPASDRVRVAQRNGRAPNGVNNELNASGSNHGSNRLSNSFVPPDKITTKQAVQSQASQSQSQPANRTATPATATPAAARTTTTTTTTATTTTTPNMEGVSTPWAIGSIPESLIHSPTPAAIDQTGARRASSSQPSPRQQAIGGAKIGAGGEATIQTENNVQSLAKKSKYQDRIFQQPATAVESVLAATCDTVGFDIAEVWLRNGPKTHQLTNSHLRPTALEDTVREELIDVYYGERSSERTHRLSPALCKRAKESNDVVWVTAHTNHGSEALKSAISDVRTAVAIPVCHAATNTNLTIIFFSIRRIIMKPSAVEFLVHMSLAAAVASVNSFADDALADRVHNENDHKATTAQKVEGVNRNSRNPVSKLSQSDHVPPSESMASKPQHRSGHYSITGSRSNLQWRQLRNVEYLTDGGTSWIHTAVLDGRAVVVKTLKPECQDVAIAINEIESELDVHARLKHTHIVGLIGGGITSKGVRFIVLDRLDGGTLSQMLGYDTRIRDRRRRFWRKRSMSYADVLRHASSVARAMAYCHEEAIPGCVVMHRDLKPDNIGFSLNGTVKIMDFGLAKIINHASARSNEVFEMSGETGSLRYMAPEVAGSLPYNHKADVYSFGMILWEMNAGKKPFDGLDREQFYDRVVHGSERPPLGKKWPEELSNLITACWSTDHTARPNFSEIVKRLELMTKDEKGAGIQKRKSFRRITGIIDRHSTWF